MSTVHVCRPQVILRRLVERCPTCECRTEMVARHYEWYSTNITCTRCGDMWGEEGRAERPFHRGWRAERVRRARRDWVVAPHGRPPGLEAFCCAPAPATCQVTP